VLEKIEECVGEFLLLYLLEMLTINILGLLLVSMVLTLIVIEGFYGMDWLVCSIGEICCGALRETSTSLVFLVRDQGKPRFVQLWWSYEILFSIMIMIMIKGYSTCRWNFYMVKPLR
jgi:membrane-bound ClpP family serine protease